MATTSKFDFGLINDKIVALGPYNGLDSDSTTAALSAAQGKAMKDGLIEIDISNQVTLGNITGLQGTVFLFYQPLTKRVRGIIALYTEDTTVSTVIPYATISPTYAPKQEVNNIHALIGSGQGSARVYYPYRMSVYTNGEIHQKLGGSTSALYSNFEYYI